MSSSPTALRELSVRGIPKCRAPCRGRLPPQTDRRLAAILPCPGSRPASMVAPLLIARHDHRTWRELCRTRCQPQSCHWYEACHPALARSRLARGRDPAWLPALRHLPNGSDWRATPAGLRQDRSFPSEGSDSSSFWRRRRRTLSCHPSLPASSRDRRAVSSLDLAWLPACLSCLPLR